MERWFRPGNASVMGGRPTLVEPRLNPTKSSFGSTESRPTGLETSQRSSLGVPVQFHSRLPHSLPRLLFRRKNCLGQQDVDASVALRQHVRATSGWHYDLQPLRLRQGELVLVESHENLGLKFQGDRHMPQVK